MCAGGDRRPFGLGYTGGCMEDERRRVVEERARIEAEYRRVLKSSVEFERRIRDRWRAKCRQKNERIAELERRVAELERRSGAQGNVDLP